MRRRSFIPMSRKPRSRVAAKLSGEPVRIHVFGACAILRGIVCATVTDPTSTSSPICSSRTVTVRSPSRSSSTAASGASSTDARPRRRPRPRPRPAGLGGVEHRVPPGRRGERRRLAGDGRGRRGRDRPSRRRSTPASTSAGSSRSATRRAASSRCGRPPRGWIRRCASRASSRRRASTTCVEADRLDLGEGATAEFMGGHAADVPDRYADASPIERLPSGVPVLLVHGDADERVPVELSRSYADAARGGRRRGRARRPRRRRPLRPPRRRERRVGGRRGVAGAVHGRRA